MWCGRHRGSNSRKWYPCRPPNGCSVKFETDLGHKARLICLWSQLFNERQPVTCDKMKTLQHSSVFSLSPPSPSSCHSILLLSFTLLLLPLLPSLLFSPSLCSVSLAHRVLHRRAHSVPTVTSLPILLRRACLTNIPPQKCHLTAFERERQWIKSQGFLFLFFFCRFLRRYSKFKNFYDYYKCNLRPVSQVWSKIRVTKELLAK